MEKASRESRLTDLVARTRPVFAAVVAAVALSATSASLAFAEDVTIVSVDGGPAILANVGSHYWSNLERSNPAAVRLNDGSLGVVWMFHGTRGQCVRISMVSDDLDPYLVLRFGDRHADPLATDDDSGPSDGALLQGQLPESGTYFVTATSSGRGEDNGMYYLDLDPC